MAYRRYYSRRKYNTSAKYKKYDLYEKFDVIAYLHNEFFNLDEETLDKSFSLYKNLYGSGAYKYLQSAYYSWKSGHIQPSAQSLQRIIECVPPFLSFEKRFYILENEIHSFAKRSFGSFTIKTSHDLEVFYKFSIDKIYSFGISNLSWFIGKGIIDEQNAELIIQCCQYVLLSKLNQEAELLILTLPEIYNELSLTRADIINATYHVKWLNLTVFIANEIKNVDIIFEKPALPSNSLQNVLISYIIENCAQIIKNEKFDLGENTAAQNQLQISRSIIDSINQSQLETEINQFFSTAIGEIRINYKIESIPMIRKELFVMISGFITLTILPCIAFLFIIILNNTVKIYPPLILAAFVASMVFFINGISKFSSINKKLSFYGQQRKRSLTYRQQQAT